MRISKNMIMVYEMPSLMKIFLSNALLVSRGASLARGVIVQTSRIYDKRENLFIGECKNFNYRPAKLVASVDAWGLYK